MDATIGSAKPLLWPITQFIHLWMMGPTLRPYIAKPNNNFQWSPAELFLPRMIIISYRAVNNTKTIQLCCDRWLPFCLNA